MVARGEYLAAWALAGLTVALGLLRLALGRETFSEVVLRLPEAEVVPLKGAPGIARRPLSALSRAEALALPGGLSLYRARRRILEPGGLLALTNLGAGEVLDLSDRFFPPEKEEGE